MNGARARHRRNASQKLNITLNQVTKMNITDVRVKRIAGDTNIKAVASITIDNDFVVKDIRVVEGKNGLFVSMPSKKIGEKYVDISHPITSQSRSALFDAILNEYRQLA